MENSLYETRLQGIMVFVFMKTTILFKMRNATTMIPCRHTHYEICQKGTIVGLFHQNKYPVQDDEYNYHDSLQAHLTIRHACRESW